MDYTGERLIPKTGLGNIEEHKMLYSRSLNFLKKEDLVLDIACGSGWGTSLLAEKAKYVIGMDISEEAIDYAGKEYLSDNSNFEYKVGSILTIPSTDSKFDVVNSIETFEHVEHSDIEKLITECHRVLANGGLFLFSTPDGSFFPYHPSSPEQYLGWHRWHYTQEEIFPLLRIFKEVKIEYINRSFFVICQK